MPQIPFALNSYTRGQGLLPRSRVVNQFVEKSTGITQAVDLLMRPSLQPFGDVAGGPTRGLFRQEGSFNGDLLIVRGTTLYRVTPAGVSTVLGTIDGSASVFIAASADEAQIATGTTFYSTDGVTVSTIAFPDSAAVASVAFINGYFVAVRTGTRRLYYTDPTTGLYDGARFIAAESAPDNLIHLLRVGDDLWGFGPSSVEIFQSTGLDTDTDPPFQRVPGRTYDKGAIAASAIVRADNTAFWVGIGEDTGLTVYRGGATPQQVSNPTVDEALARCDFTYLVMWQFPVPGHLFIMLGLGPAGTWAYDVGTNEWFEWESYGRTSWRAHLACVAGPGPASGPGTVIVGDDTTGALWRLDSDEATDDGDPIVRIFTAGVPVQGSRTPCDSLSLYCAVGQGPVDENQVIRLRVSDDQGRTYWQAEDEYLGRGGEYSTRVRWTRLGLMEAPGRLFEWQVSDNVRTRFTAAFVNDSL